MGGCGEGGDEVPEMGWTREIVANVGNPQVSAGPLFHRGRKLILVHRLAAPQRAV